MRDIQLVLERWVLGLLATVVGATSHPLPLGSKDLFRHPRSREHPAAMMMGLTVSSAVNCLKKKNPYLCTLIEWHYVLDILVRIMVTKLGISHTQVLKRLQSAEGSIDGCLAMLDVSLEMDRYTSKEPQSLPKRIPLTA